METFELSVCQEKARIEFEEFLRGDEQFFILTGGPGRGKSFITEQLIKDARSILGSIPIHATATTNKAAKVVSEFTGAGAGTIHSLLGLRVKNDFKTGRTSLSRTSHSTVVSNAFIVIDEISMIDNDLLTAIDEGTVRCRFLLVGDKDQLAPIMQNKPPVFQKGYRSVELKTVMRQKSDSRIIQLAEQLKETVNTGVFKPIIADGYDVVHLDGDEFQRLVDMKFTEDLGPDMLKIICWKNSTVRAYNNYIRGRHHDESYFVEGETVVTNDPISSNGEMVYSTDEFAKIINSVASTEHGIEGHWYRLDRGIRVFQANDQDEVTYLLKQVANEAKVNRGWAHYFQLKEFFADLRAVHSCTTYKSQGSSYHAVFIDLTDIGECRQWEQVARQLYVAVTRAKHRVYLYGTLPPKYHNFSHKVT